MIKNFIKFQSLWYLVSSLLDRHMGRLNLNGSELNSEPSLIYVASNQNIQPDHMCSPCVRYWTCGRTVPSVRDPRFALVRFLRLI